MSKALKSISASNKLAFYYDAKNIKNQELINDVANCYKNGSGAKVFTLIELLNLVYKQEQYLVNNCNNPQIAFKTITELPLSAIQKHLLYFNIIWWFGGVYNLNPKLRHTLWLIENEFKKYKTNTPEKDFYFKNKDEFEKLTFKQVKELILKFHQLSYLEKLKYWEDTFGYEYSISFSSRGFYSENDIEEIGPKEMINPDFAISIYPENKTETEQHNFWLLGHIQKNKTTEHCNFEYLKENYFSKVKDNPHAIEFTEQEIESINKQKAREKKLIDEKQPIRLWGYYFGYQSVVMRENPYLQLDAHDFKKICLAYAKGIADAHYLGFLETQLDKLKKGENVLSQIIELLPDKINNTSINSKKFYNIEDFKHMIIELMKLDPLLSFHVNDFLEFHYSQAAFTTRWSRVNWFTMFRKTLFMCGYKDDKYHINDLPPQIRNAFYWERRKSFDLVNAMPKEQISETVPTVKLKSIIGVANFDYTNKENYFFADKIDVFKQIEQELVLKEYIDTKGKWNKEKRHLVALIHTMYNLKYMRPKINGKSEKNTKLDYRRFFEKRYNTELSQEMKPSKFPPNKVKDYIYEFHFIPEIEKL